MHSTIVAAVNAGDSGYGVAGTIGDWTAVIVLSVAFVGFVRRVMRRPRETAVPAGSATATKQGRARWPRRRVTDLIVAVVAGLLLAGALFQPVGERSAPVTASRSATDAVHAGFVAGCADGGSGRTYCECVWTEVNRRSPLAGTALAEFGRRMDRFARTGNLDDVPAAALAAVDACEA